MATVTVTTEEFLELFPEFNQAQYEPYAYALPIYLSRAQVYLGVHYGNSSRWDADKRKLAIYLLTAHLCKLHYDMMTGSATAGQVASASVDGVSVSYVQLPTSDDAWSYWLSLTPWGLELLALLATLTATPFYIGGSMERVF